MILTLNTDDAVRAGIADANRADARRGARAARTSPALRAVTQYYTFGEQLARFATDPARQRAAADAGMLGLLDRDADAARHRRH